MAKVKTQLDHRGYCIDLETIPKHTHEQIKKDLTMVPQINYEMTSEERNRLMFKLYNYTDDKKHIIVPRYYGVSRFGAPVETNFDEAEEIDIEFTKALRPKQIEVSDLCIKYMLKNGGGLLSVPCGFGKTVCSLYIAQKLGYKTLVIVHKSFLLKQWAERAIEFLNIKPENIGIIKQNKCRIEGKDIVIGMVQTISKRDYNEWYKQFGLIIYDEAHHASAKHNSKTLQKISCKYTLSLTATPYRGDGLIRIMHWYLGGTIYRERVKMNDKVIIKSILHQSSDRDYFRTVQRWYKGGYVDDASTMMKNITKIDSKNQKIIKIITHTRRRYPERKILVLSQFIEHLEVLKAGVDQKIKEDIDRGLIDEEDVFSCFYIGRSTDNQRQDAEERGDIIFATYSMANEALDIKQLNTLIFASPKKDVIQSCGRIMRKILEPGDCKPMIVDFQDDIKLFTKWYNIRKQYYEMCKYQIEDYYMKDGEFMTGNRYYELDNIKDEDRPQHTQIQVINKLINQSNREYDSWKEQLRNFEDLCATISGEVSLTDQEIAEKYNLVAFEQKYDTRVFDDFEPYKLSDILYVEPLTNKDFEIKLLKCASENEKLDIDGDIKLDNDSPDTMGEMTGGYKPKIKIEPKVLYGRRFI